MVNKSIVASRLALIEDALKEMRSLGGTEKDRFLRDRTAVAAVESYLRRSLEALFDAARHLLVHQGWHDFSLEYKSLAKGLSTRGVVPQDLEIPLVQMAGYRNRLVHFYHEVTPAELFDIIQSDLGDLERAVRHLKDYARTL
jgi:uncharacterized protein YutE (UPF0331/DUF86 family)